MPYIVKAEPKGSPKPIELKFGTVAAAVAQARAHLKGGAQNVSIQDGRGNRVEGATLEAACQGKLSLTDDLKPVGSN